MRFECPLHWYNAQNDLKIQLPTPLDIKDDSQYHSSKLMHSLSDACVSIPEEVLALYKKYRPTELRRALNFEKQCKSKCSIYFKYEGNNPSGSHKLNAALPQVFYSKLDGFEEVVTATGAGQWGTAVAFAAKQYGVKCTIFMTGSTYDRMPERVSLMKLLGAKVIRSPSRNSICADGSMALATSEAVEYAQSHQKTAHLFGLIMHQSIIGLEAKEQMKNLGCEPDIIIGCVGGGTNFGGIISPFLADKILKSSIIDFVAVEPCENPTLTKGNYDYDYVDYKGLTSKMKVYSIGHKDIPAPIAAGGLRYHAADQFISKLCYDGILRAVAVKQKDALKAGFTFFETEGILPAPESSYAIYQAMIESKKDENKGRTILVNISGHGHYDVNSYYKYII